MALTGDAGSRQRLTFWFGCNMLRHAELIRLSVLLLEKAGFDVATVGGPAYCCGTAHDHQPKAASAMAHRTVERFNVLADRDARGTVVTWCPSCHMHMSDIMAPGAPTRFDTAHVCEILADASDRLAPLMTATVKRRVLLHRHSGFQSTHVAVNDRVESLLRRIEGLEVVVAAPLPGHMCSSLASAPGALRKAAEVTWSSASSAGCDTLATVFHSCHREFAAMDGKDGISVRNWLHLIAESMGLEVADAYLEWRKGKELDREAIERANPRHVEALVIPELKKAPPLER